MANSFFDFDTSLKGDLDLKNGAPLLPEDEEGYDEEEYDALNDETFGQSTLDDWEEQHKQFAEIKESSRHNDKLENSISQLGLDDSSDDDVSKDLLTFPKDSSVWAYTPIQKNGELSYHPNPSAVLSSLQKASKSFIENQTNNAAFSYLNQQRNNSLPSTGFPSTPGKICTVEELEKNLIQNSQQAKLQNTASIETKAQELVSIHNRTIPHTPVIASQNQALLSNLHHASQNQQRPPYLQLAHHTPYHPLLQHSNARMPPPGLPPLNIPPPNMRLPPSLTTPHPMLPPGFRMIQHPHLMPPNGVARSPAFSPYTHSLPVNHQYNFPPPPHSIAPSLSIIQCQNKSTVPRMQQGQTQQYSPQRPQPQYGQQYPQRMRHEGESHRHSHGDGQDNNRDEYAGLMTLKDKQWLLNIQLLQLNTGTPYFDDYYYTISKERKAKSKKENVFDRSQKYQTNGRLRRNSDRQENNNLTPKVYTPLQFENSLGKLQCGSVMAPRKIIDMDIVQMDKEQDVPLPSKDSRKTKQYLLELEALYSLLLKAEDIKNPLFISNMEKWREIKQKQRLKELEQATTTEQKQEVLRWFQLESEPIVENQTEYIIKICNGFVQDEKFSSFLNIRKGKMLLLRLLPHLSVDYFSSQLLDIWSRVLLSLPLIGRRDTAGDNILPKLYPYFARFVQTCTMSDIIDMISGLMEVVKPENNRSTPLSHVGKAPLYFVVLNKFGVSALICLLVRAEQIFSTVDPTENQLNRWTEFLSAWATHSDSVSKVAVPLTAIPLDVFKRHVDRFNNQLTHDKCMTLKKFYVDINIVN
ncbi:protein PAT1 homolog 1 [Anthonomus grandis grandis]|uniref:protein PAT1 homolog 1 n=1 Tax=Anthonomus grandis grandis TaxID=2921223 RepID=UPI002166B5E3|nr:protein PAT1 homolog 1 [Anthonomus grandis grandis]